MTHSISEGLAPIGASESRADLRAPELLRPPLHLLTSRDVFTRPIRTDPMFQHGPNAYSGRADRGGITRTGQAWKSIAETINDLSGGSRAKSGLLDFYPADYREIFDYIAGSQSRPVHNVITSSADLIHGKRPESTHVPLERVFNGTDYEAANRSI